MQFDLGFFFILYQKNPKPRILYYQHLGMHGGVAAALSLYLRQALGLSDEAIAESRWRWARVGRGRLYPHGAQRVLAHGQVRHRHGRVVPGEVQLQQQPGGGQGGDGRAGDGRCLGT